MNAQTDEETVKPCIQDILRGYVIHVNEFIDSHMLLITVSIYLIIIYVFYKIGVVMGYEYTPMDYITIIFTMGTLGIAFFQYNINKRLLTFEQQRDRTIQRMKHELILIDEPLGRLRGRIRYYSDVITNVNVNLGTGEIFIPRMNITDRISREEELLLEHLNTGYSQLLQSIHTYHESYNGIADRVLATYQKGMDLLVHSWGTEKKLITVESSPKTFCAIIINIFKDEVSNRLFQKHEPNYARIENMQIIKFGSREIHAQSGADANQIVCDINLILEGSEVYEEIKKLWKEAKLLQEERRRIDYNIDRLIVSVKAGIHLEGWCTVGIRANYEHSYK